MTKTGNIDVLDEYGLRTGEVLPRTEVHRLGKRHRVVHLYLFDRSNCLLLQRRSPLREQDPGVFTISILGHIEAGESSGETVRREVEEELGLDASDLNFEFLFSYSRDAKISPTSVDRQFNDVYACWADFSLEDLALDHNEVSEVKLVSFDEFRTMVEHGSGGLAPVYGDECRDLAYFLRNRFAT
jgi:isopentenyl-diphosphate Delta-isomerase